jgi:arabinose-5-phosphate isomerase
VALDCHVSVEACPMNLVPTASTTAALALGDALAMTVLVEKGFKPEDFANLHPGGTLGKRLMRARQLMHAGDDCPIVRTDDPVHVVLDTITKKGLGMTAVASPDGRLAGIITDGDLRRKLAAGLDLRAYVAREIMTANPVTVTAGTMAVEALPLLEQRKITSVVVIDDDRRIEGVLHLHDLWRTGKV